MPDIVIADHDLPDGRAVELLRAAAYPLLVIVGEGCDAEVEEATNAGALDCIPACEAALEALPRIVERVMRKWNRMREGQRAARLLDTQFEVASALLGGRTLGETGPAVLAAICRNVGWALGEIWRLDAPHQILRREAFWADDDAIQEAASARPAVAFVEDPLLTGGGFVGAYTSIPDLGELPDIDRRGLVRIGGLRSAHAFALDSGDALVGVMTFFARDVDAPDPELQRLLEAIAVQLALFAIRQETMEDRERVATIGATAAALMHDIAGPLNGMHLAGQLMQQRLQGIPDMDDKIATNLGHLVTETRRLVALLDDYRSRWGRIERRMRANVGKASATR